MTAPDKPTTTPADATVQGNATIQTAQTTGTVHDNTTPPGTVHDNTTHDGSGGDDHHNWLTSAISDAWGWITGSGDKKTTTTDNTTTTSTTGTTPTTEVATGTVAAGVGAASTTNASWKSSWAESTEQLLGIELDDGNSVWDNTAAGSGPAAKTKDGKTVVTDATNTGTAKKSEWDSMWDELLGKSGTDAGRTNTTVTHDGNNDVTQINSTDKNGHHIEATANGVTATDGTGTITRNSDGTVSAVSADGKNIYNKDANGDQRYQSKDNGMGVNYHKADGTAHVTDLPGGLQEVTGPDGTVKTLANGKKVVTETGSSSKFDRSKMQDDQLYFFNGDDTIAVKHNGNYYYYKKDFNTDIVTKNGRLKIDHGQMRFYRNGDDNGVVVNDQNLHDMAPSLKDNKGNSIVHTDSTGKVVLNQAAVAPQGVEIQQTQQAVTAKVAHASNTGETATITVKNGCTDFVIPHEFRTHTDRGGETAYDERPGHENERMFSYNFNTRDFNTPEIDFNPTKTTLGWNGDTIDANGDVKFADGSDLYSQGQAQQAAADSQTAVQGAAQAVSEVNGRLGSGTVQAGDPGLLSARMGDITRAMAECIAAGNPAPLSSLLAAYDSCSALANSSYKPADEARLAYSQGIFDQDAVARMQKGSQFQTVTGAVDAELARRRPGRGDEDLQQSA